MVGDLSRAPINFNLSEAELVLLPKQNLKSLNSRRRLVPSEGRKYQSKFLRPKSPYLY